MVNVIMVLSNKSLTPGDEFTLRNPKKTTILGLLKEFLADSDTLLCLLGSQEIADGNIPGVTKSCVTQVLKKIKRCHW